MYLVGYGKNSDGYIVPIMTNTLEKGASKMLCYDDGSCGGIVIDGFDEFELMSASTADDQLGDATKAAMRAFGENASIVLVIKDDDGKKFLVVDSMNDSFCNIYSPEDPKMPEHVGLKFIYMEAEEGDPDYAEYLMDSERYIY